MASKYHPVPTKFWSDWYDWDSDMRLLALYLWTCPHRTSEGLFRLPKSYITGDLGWSAERLAKPFAKLLQNGFIAYDESASVILLRQALEHQPPQNPNQEKAAVNMIAELPQTPLLPEFLRLAERFAKGLAERLRQRLPQSLTLNSNSKNIPEANASGAPDGAQGGEGRAEQTEGKVPKAMLGAVHHLLAVTGRERSSFSEDERKAAYDLNRNHTCGAVCTEINRAAERFKRQGRPLAELTLRYIEESMRQRPPTIGSKKAEWERARAGPGPNPFASDSA